jgi:hypothetical protein
MTGIKPWYDSHTLLLCLLATAAVVQMVACTPIGSADIPPSSPVPVSKELADQLRDRLNRTKDAKGAFTVEITDQELTSYVVTLLQSGAGEFPARDMQVRFTDGYVEVWATFVEVAPIEIPAYLGLRIGVTQGHLSFHIEKAIAAGVPVPGAMREALALIGSETLAELLEGLAVQQVEVKPGKVYLSGQVTGDLPDLPERL